MKKWYLFLGNISSTMLVTPEYLEHLLVLWLIKKLGKEGSQCIAHEALHEVVACLNIFGN